MLNKSSDYISISLIEDVLKIVHLKGSGLSSKLIKAFVKDLKGVAPTQISSEIQTALKDFKTKSANLVAIVPPGMLTTKSIEVPSTAPSEVESIVSLQATRHTPLSREEIQVGSLNLGVYNNNQTKVLLVIANKSGLRDQLNIFEQAGMRVKHVLFAPEGAAQFYKHALKLKSDPKPVGIIDIDKYSTEFIIASNGLVMTSRSLPVGKSQLKSDGEEARNKLIEELGKTIESYQSEGFDEVPSEFVLTSDDEHTKALQPLLKEKLQWESKIVSYIDCVKAGKGVLESIATDVDEGSLFDNIVATSMVNETAINLLPEEDQLQKNIEVQGKEVFKMAILGVALLVLIATFYGMKIYFNSTYLTTLKDKFRENSQEVIELKERSRRTKMIKEYLEGRMVSLDTINELYRTIPKEVYLTNLLMDQEGNISIQGISDIASIVFNLGTTLKESELFKSVEIQSTTAKKDRGKDVSAFEITLKLVSAEDDEMAAEEIEE